MTDVKHTPGPWLRSGTTVYALNEQRENRTCFNVANGGFISRSHDHASSDVERTPDAEHEANARLIAAAPDLLAQLRSLVVKIERGAFIRSDLKAAKAAISKATGAP